MFEIKKGTKQGDPLSSLLFNTVLQMVLKDDLPRWQKKRGMGICPGDNNHDCLKNMSFADDVLLFASSKEQLQKNAVRLHAQHRKVGTQNTSRQNEILSSQSSNSEKK